MPFSVISRFFPPSGVPAYCRTSTSPAPDRRTAHRRTSVSGRTGESAYFRASAPPAAKRRIGMFPPRPLPTGIQYQRIGAFPCFRAPSGVPAYYPSHTPGPAYRRIGVFPPFCPSCGIPNISAFPLARPLSGVAAYRRISAPTGVPA